MGLFIANFHLANGAVLWRINFLADTSIRGLNQSCGLMVNYRYYLDKAETNSQEYLLHQRISASNDVLDLIGSDTTTFKTIATPARQNSASSSPFRESGSEWWITAARSPLKWHNMLKNRYFNLSKHMHVNFAKPETREWEPIVVTPFPIGQQCFIYRQHMITWKPCLVDGRTSVRQLC